MKRLLFTCGLVLLCCFEAKIFEKCDFAKVARTNNLTDIDKWICLAYHESGLNSEARNGNNYGILQISGEGWCGQGNKCGVPCQSLLDSDIADDLRCAKRIYNYFSGFSGRDGFRAWGSSSRCKGDQRQWMNGCKI